MLEEYMRYPLNLSSRATAPRVHAVSQGAALTPASGAVHPISKNLSRANSSVLFLNNTSLLTTYETKNILLLSQLEVQVDGKWESLALPGLARQHRD